MFASVVNFFVSNFVDLGQKRLFTVFKCSKPLSNLLGTVFHTSKTKC